MEGLPQSQVLKGLTTYDHHGQIKKTTATRHGMILQVS